MKTREKIGETLALASSLVEGLALVPRGEAFDVLGPSLPPRFAGSHYRTWALAGTEAESRRRVEALLAQEGGWRTVSRTTYPNLNTGPDMTFQYFNDATKDECCLYVRHSFRGAEQIRVVIDRMTLWRLLANRMGFGPSSART